MSHDIRIDEQDQASIFTVEQAPWHGLGAVLQQPPTAAKGIQAAQLDWEVDKAPLFYHLSIEHTGIVQGRYALIPGNGWIGRERPVFGLASDKYKVLQNREAFAFFDPLVSKGHASYESAGSLGKGERVWVLAKIKGDMTIGPDDKVDRYLLLSNTHDGQNAVKVLFTPIRVVCQNTLSMALNDIQNAISIPHDALMAPRLNEVADKLYLELSERYCSIEEGFRRLYAKPLETPQAKGYFQVVYPDPPPLPEPVDEPQAQRRLKQCAVSKEDRDECLNIFENGRFKNMRGARTMWGAYNAVTEYEDHFRRVRYGQRWSRSRLNSIWFGESRYRKLRAFKAAREFASKKA